MIQDIGGRIAELRRMRGMNQETLAELAMLSRITIARYESGTIEPGAKALGRIADALEVTTDALLGRTDEIHDIGEQPKTTEARILASGIDKLPKDQREQALNIMRAVYANKADLFGKGDEK